MNPRRILLLDDLQILREIFSKIVKISLVFDFDGVFFSTGVELEFRTLGEFQILNALQRKVKTLLGFIGFEAEEDPGEIDIS